MEIPSTLCSNVYDFAFGSVRPELTYSIFPIWDDNAREQFEFAPGH